MVSDQLSSKFYKANNVIPTLHILSQSDVEGVVSESHRALLSPGIQGRLASLTFCSPPYSLHSPSLQGYLPPLNVIITNKQQQQKLRAHVISKNKHVIIVRVNISEDCVKTDWTHPIILLTYLPPLRQCLVWPRYKLNCNSPKGPRLRWTHWSQKNFHIGFSIYII